MKESRKERGDGVNSTPHPQHPVTQVHFLIFTSKVSMKILFEERIFHLKEIRSFKICHIPNYIQRDEMFVIKNKMLTIQGAQNSLGGNT